MKKSEFINEIAAELEVNAAELNEETVLTSIPDSDSMSLLVIMSVVDDKFGITLTADDFKNVTTIKDLMQIIGLDKFEE
jgi:acyl carrier protein